MPASVPIFEATHLARWFWHQHSWIAACAHRHLLQTARFEPASGAYTCQIRSLSLNSRKPHSAVSRVQEMALRKTYQCFCVGMQGAAKNVVCFSLFNNSSGVHNQNAVDKSGHDGWIMADDEEDSAILLTNF